VAIVTNQIIPKSVAIGIQKIPKKEEAIINMVLGVTTRNKVPKIVAFKEKEPQKEKFAHDWKEEEKFQKSFEATIKEMQDKEPPLFLPCFPIGIGISRTRMEPTDLSKLIGSTKVHPLVKTLGD
jgi:hypothetical protein